jgi:hypothetical protein
MPSNEYISSNIENLLNEAGSRLDGMGDCLNNLIFSTNREILAEEKISESELVENYKIVKNLISQYWELKNIGSSQLEKTKKRINSYYKEIKRTAVLHILQEHYSPAEIAKKSDCEKNKLSADILKKNPRKFYSFAQSMREADYRMQIINSIK